MKDRNAGNSMNGMASAKGTGWIFPYCASREPSGPMRITEFMNERVAQSRATGAPRKYREPRDRKKGTSGSRAG
jgi:hypothetical protein